MTRSLEIGSRWDRLWHALRGEMERSKKPALLALAEKLIEERPDLAAKLNAAEREALGRLPS